MTQEILDCLLIKAQFLSCSEEELLAKMDDEAYLAIYCDSICRILEEDNFFFTSQMVMDKLRTVVHTKRFQKRYDNETITDFNTILDYVHKYDRMDNSDKILLTAEWIKKEADDRILPFRRLPGYDLDSIYNLIVNEYYYYQLLINDTDKMEIFDTYAFLSAINFIINRYPIILLTNDGAFDKCYSSILFFKESRPKLRYRKMIEGAILQLDKLEEIKDTKEARVVVKMLKKD